MTTTPAHPASARQGLLARHPLVSYFLIAFAFTWTLLFSVLLSRDGLGLLPYSVSPAMARLIVPAALLGPSVAAVIVTGATEGWAGVGSLLRRIVRWRVGFRWYLFVLVGLPAVMVLGTLLRPGALASFDISALPSAIAYLGAFAFMVVLGGRCSRSRAGAASPCPGCSGCMVPWSGASSWGACGPCGTCPGSWSRKSYRRRARSWTS